MVLIHDLVRAPVASTSNIPFLPYHPAHTVHLLGRTLRLTKERVSDIMLYRRLRARASSSWWRRFLTARTWDVALVRTALLECAQLVSQIDDVIQARGDYPHPKRWKDPTRFRSLLYTGDLVLLLLILVLVLFPDGGLLPRSLVP
jgi:hypothetical protein